MNSSHISGLLLVLLASAQTAWPDSGAIGGAADHNPVTPSMLKPIPDSGVRVRVLFTFGDSIGDYRPPGLVDGLAAFPLPGGGIRVLATHELPARQGYPYALANGLQLTGSRVSYFDLDAAARRVIAAGPAYERIYDRRGAEVTDARQLNGRWLGSAGLDVLCSAAGYGAGQKGFRDDIFFVHEETSALEDHPHGGSVWALDMRGRALWALPALGRGSWENSAAVEAPPGFVALLLGDDLEFGAAPLYLWIGRVQPDGDFLSRNGLRDGRLHVWVADDGSADPQAWHGSGTRRAGRFVPVETREPACAGRVGCDADGYLDDTRLRDRAFQAGAFRFSRPEDLHTNPADGLTAAFASTGHGRLFPADDWGTLYEVRVAFVPAGAGGLPGATAVLSILYDSDETGDHGIRSPDNLVWAHDGAVYVQEDKATKLGRFGAESGREASVWRLDPTRPAAPRRLAEIDRSVLLPAGVTDSKAGEMGEWETSGIIDLSALIDVEPDETALLLSVQAHGLRDGPIGGRSQLVQGGQLVLLTVAGADRGGPEADLN